MFIVCPTDELYTHLLGVINFHNVIICLVAIVLNLLYCNCLSAGAQIVLIIATVVDWGFCLLGSANNSQTRRADFPHVQVAYAKKLYFALIILWLAVDAARFCIFLALSLTPTDGNKGKIALMFFANYNAMWMSVHMFVISINFAYALKYRCRRLGDIDRLLMQNAQVYGSNV